MDIKDQLAKMLQTGDPTEAGMYVVYTDAIVTGASHTRKFCLTWCDAEWWHPGSNQQFRGNVYTWIGPLPSPSFEELMFGG